MGEGRTDGGTERCIGCGARVPKVDGPTHRYLESAPGCWELYGRVLAKEYSDALYAGVHGLTVDAYALQHPGTPSPQTIQSAALHLISLYLHYELELGRDGMARARKRAKAVLGRELEWLEPPEHRGEITVVDVERADDAIEHRDVVERWARSTWDAWSPHHGIVTEWVARLRDEP